MNRTLKVAGWVKYGTGLLLLAAAAGAQAQGNYERVKPKDLVGASFNHYFNDQRKAVSPPDFHWTFTATNLTITPGKGAIPPDLMNQLAEDLKDVKKIEASWKLDPDGLVLSSIKVDGKPTPTVCKMAVGRTAPTVIRIGERQYVFVPKN